MVLNEAQLSALLKMANSVDLDDLNCDGCYQLIPEFYESETAERPFSEVLDSVRIHLKNCPCCADEYRAILEAMAAVDQTV